MQVPWKCSWSHTHSSLLAEENLPGEPEAAANLCLVSLTSCSGEATLAWDYAWGSSPVRTQSILSQTWTNTAKWALKKTVIFPSSTLCSLKVPAANVLIWCAIGAMLVQCPGAVLWKFLNFQFIGNKISIFLENFPNFWKFWNYFQILCVAPQKPTLIKSNLNKLSFSSLKEQKLKLFGILC